MNTHPTRRRWADSAAWLVIGVIAVALVAAILTAALNSARTSDRVAHLTTQLHAARAQITALQADAARAQNDSTAERDALRTQNRQIRRQLNALIRYARAHGLTVPDVVLTPPTGGSTTGPKDTAPRQPGKHHGSPGHTGATDTPTPTPSTGPGPGLVDPQMLCTLLHLNPCPLSRREVNP